MLRWTSTLGLVVSIGSVLHAQDVATFTPLGDLAGGKNECAATALTPDGGLVVGYAGSANASTDCLEAFRWDATNGIVGLGDLPGSFYESSAYAVSADGSTIVGTSRRQHTTDAYPEYHAFRSDGVVMEDLGDFPTYAWASTVARGASADGSVITGYAVWGGYYESNAFLWTSATGMTDLGVMPGSSITLPMAISDDGEVITGYASGVPGGTEAFQWTASGGFVALGAGSKALGASSDGSIVVGRAAQTNGFGAWTAATGWTPLGGGEATAVSDDGQVIVGTNSYAGGSDALVWTPEGGLEDLERVLENGHGLDLGGYALSAINDVSPDGTLLAGYAQNTATGDNEAVLIRLPRTRWQDLGHALAGTNGEAHLYGRGSLLPGTEAELAIENARPFSAGVLVIGLSRIDLPFAGGTMVPALDVLVGGIPVPASGSLAIAGDWPAGIPSGTEAYFQFWFNDPAAPKRLAATNAMKCVAP